ncbi:YcxB family protein [Marasmitruncus massiliensis]|uniref:YcxB family protein n=1 Tax=Marasmitruncus massiliensis TaxID=1944642 RepID=UPI000C79860B|nr:YcxB family protein [Marasmitruncus massiliensis]
MEVQPMIIHTKMDKRVFTDFSNFNSFRMNGRWLSLALFPVVMGAFGIVNLITDSRLLFYLFCAAGVAMPLLYLVFYHVSLKRQITAYHLDKSRSAYTVSLSADGIAVSTEKEQTSFRWDQVYRVFELDTCTYVYITKARAFLLPHSDLSQATPEQLHQVFLDYLPRVRLFDRRKKRV